MTVANLHRGRTIEETVVVMKSILGDKFLFQKGEFEQLVSFFRDLKVILFQTPSWADKTFDESDFDDEAYYAALGTRPPINMEELDETYQKVIELFSVCTNEDPKDRPSAAHIVEALEMDVQWAHIRNCLSFKYGLRIKLFCLL